MQVFVTVGTTKFKDLVEMALSIAFMDVLVSHGYRRMIIQTGASHSEPITFTHKTLNVESFTYTKRINEYISESNLVISHCGAGTILDVFELGIPLIVVVNEGLMDNHQAQLADKLYSMNLLSKCTLSSLVSTLANQPNDIVKFTFNNGLAFNEFLSEMMLAV
jgi:beta-1,4-N-acetylglucosaminyltransferase